MVAGACLFLMGFWIGLGQLFDISDQTIVTKQIFPHHAGYLDAGSNWCGSSLTILIDLPLQPLHSVANIIRRFIQ